MSKVDPKQIRLKNLYQRYYSYADKKYIGSLGKNEAFDKSRDATWSDVILESFYKTYLDATISETNGISGEFYQSKTLEEVDQLKSDLGYKKVDSSTKEVTSSKDTVFLTGGFQDDAIFGNSDSKGMAAFIRVALFALQFIALRLILNSLRSVTDFLPRLAAESLDHSYHLLACKIAEINRKPAITLADRAVMGLCYLGMSGGIVGEVIFRTLHLTLSALITPFRAQQEQNHITNIIWKATHAIIGIPAKIVLTLATLGITVWGFLHTLPLMLKSFATLPTSAASNVIPPAPVSLHQGLGLTNYGFNLWPSIKSLVVDGLNLLGLASSYVSGGIFAALGAFLLLYTQIGDSIVSMGQSLLQSKPEKVADKKAVPVGNTNNKVYSAVGKNPSSAIMIPEEENKEEENKGKEKVPSNDNTPSSSPEPKRYSK